MKNKLHTSLRNPSLVSLFEWESDERRWIEKTREWYIIYAVFFLMIIIILIFLNEFIFILGTLAFAFLWFIQGSVSPEKTKHVVTSLGIKTFGRLYKWKEIDNFWFSIKDGIYSLDLDLFPEKRESSKARVRITLLVNEEDLERIFETLIKYIEYGNKDEIGYNFLTQAIYGSYIDITRFMKEEEVEK